MRDDCATNTRTHTHSRGPSTLILPFSGGIYGGAYGRSICQNVVKWFGCCFSSFFFFVFFFLCAFFFLSLVWKPNSSSRAFRLAFKIHVFLLIFLFHFSVTVVISFFFFFFWFFRRWRWWNGKWCGFFLFLLWPFSISTIFALHIFLFLPTFRSFTFSVWIASCSALVHVLVCEREKRHGRLSIYPLGHTAWHTMYWVTFWLRCFPFYSSSSFLVYMACEVERYNECILFSFHLPVFISSCCFFFVVSFALCAQKSKESRTGEKMETEQRIGSATHTQTETDRTTHCYSGVHSAIQESRDAKFCAQFICARVFCECFFAVLFPFHFISFESRLAEPFADRDFISAGCPWAEGRPYYHHYYDYYYYY